MIKEVGAIDLDNLPETQVLGEDEKWYVCKPSVQHVKRGGKIVIYTTADGTEVKREMLRDYIAREDDRAKALELLQKYSFEEQMDA